MKNFCGITGLVAIVGLCASVAAARPAYQEAKSSSKSMISVQSNDGTDTYDIRVTDGKVVAKRNGEVIPEDRIRKTQNGDEVTIDILDEEGNVLKSFDLNKATTPKVHLRAVPGQTAKTWSSAAPKAKGGFRAIEPAEGGAFAITAPDIMDNPPPVMVGVTMSEPGPSVLEFLKLEKGVVFDRVIDGLPAAKAGVQAGDILVEIKGEKNIDQERFREILRGTKAGDALEMKVARAGGEIQTLKLSLVAFDAKALGRAEPDEDMYKNPLEVYSHGGSHKNWDDAHKALTEAMANLKSAKLDEKVQKTIKDSLAKAMESLEEAKDSMRDVQIFSNNGQWNQRSPKLRVAPNGENKLIVVPGTPTPSMPGMDDERINKLEKKVDDLNRKLDSIMELLKDRK